MKAQEKIWSFFAAVIGLPILVFVLVSWYETRISGLPVMGPSGHKVGGFHFTNQNGKMVSENDWKKKIVVANFFFTHCPVVCPKMTQNLQKVAAANDPSVVIHSFSVDPERDDQNRLQWFAHKFKTGPSWNLLTGDKKALYRFARKDLMLVATDGDGGDEDFIHSENLVLIDPDHRIRGYYRGTSASETEQLIRDINKLKLEYGLR